MWYNSAVHCLHCLTNCNFVFPFYRHTDGGPVNSMWITAWNDNCEAKSEAKGPRPLRGLQVDFSLTRNVSYAVR